MLFGLDFDQKAKFTKFEISFLSSDWSKFPNPISISGCGPLEPFD